MHENCPLWHCPLSDFYEVMKKNSIFVPSIYIHEKLIMFYSKIVPSKVMMKNSIIVPSIYFHLKPSIEATFQIAWKNLPITDLFENHYECSYCDKKFAKAWVYEGIS